MSETIGPRPPIKIEPIPPAELKKTQGTFFGRLVTWLLSLIGIRIETEAEKAAKIFEAKTLQIQKTTREIKFQKNLKTLKKLTAENLLEYKVVDGRFAKVFEMEELPEQKMKERRNELMDLIHQTYRQLWGQMIDADRGFRVKVEVQNELDALKKHLSDEFPEVLKASIEMPGSPLKVLSGTYRLAQTKDVPEKILQAREKEEQRIANKVGELLTKEKIVREKPDIDSLGVNPTVFIRKEGKEGYLAVEKPIVDDYYGEVIATIQKKPLTTKSKYGLLAGVNELIASGLDFLVGGIFNVPLTSFSNGKTLHSFQTNQGSYSAKIRNPHTNEKDELTKTKFIDKMPLLQSQRFILIQMAMGNWDGHSRNILIDKNRAPIPIDFGRSLGIDPNNLYDHLRAAFLDWDAMDEPLDEADRALLANLDVEDVIRKLEQMVLAHPERDIREGLEDPTIVRLIHKQLDRLKAHLYLLKAGAAHNLTPRQMMALFLPPISKTQDIYYKEFLKGIRYSQKHFDQLQNGTIEEKRNFYVQFAQFKSHVKQSGFISAWNAAQTAQGLDATKFNEELEQEIRRIEEIPEDRLFTDRERLWYGITGFYDAF